MVLGVVTVLVGNNHNCDSNYYYHMAAEVISMGINALTARRLADRRRRGQIREVLQRNPPTAIYYEIHSGIMDYRTGRWIRQDMVTVEQTLFRAREELKARQTHPTENQNAAYITRRYHHGNQNTAETMEGIY